MSVAMQWRLQIVRLMGRPTVTKGFQPRQWPFFPISNPDFGVGAETTKGVLRLLWAWGWEFQCESRKQRRRGKWVRGAGVTVTAGKQSRHSTYGTPSAQKSIFFNLKMTYIGVLCGALT